MIELFAGLTVGIPAMWLYRQLIDITALTTLKTRKRALMKEALRHTGGFSELLHMQKQIVLLSCTHLRRIALPACVACAPIIALLAIQPTMATTPFFIGIVGAYFVAKWRWKI